MISGDTTIARLLDEHPSLLEFLAGYNAHFERLRNRELRTVMAPRVTVAEAARMAGVPSDELVAALRRAAGEAAPVVEASAPADRPDAPVAGARPAALAAAPAARIVHLDVREDIRRGEEPFARIMAAVKALGAENILVLRAPFEPVPLYRMLAPRGLAHWTERHAADDWSVWFYRDVAAAGGGAPGAVSDGPPRTITLDVRDLEPPQPMVLVLERLDALAPGQALEVLHSRRPLFLYPQLDDRGFVHETDEPEPGLVRILIRHADAAP